MTPLITWMSSTLIASSMLMLLALVLRAPFRRLVGPTLGYWLWALPAVRLIMPPLPPLSFGLLQSPYVAEPMAALFRGPVSSSTVADALPTSWVIPIIAVTWCMGAAAVLITNAVRHARFCRSLRRVGTDLGDIDGIRVIAAEVEGPLAFGVWRRCIAVPPRLFADEYTPIERDLVFSHEAAHHARGDIAANWAALTVLAAHWWNPIAWKAMRAFREDQELAADAHVLAERPASARAAYAHVLARASGISAFPVCNLHSRSNLKSRLMMIRQQPLSTRRILIGGTMLFLLGSAALAASAAGPPNAVTRGAQAVTIGVKPDGTGDYSYFAGKTPVPRGAALPKGLKLPAHFSGAGGCGLGPEAKPFAMVIKGSAGTQTYTVICASAGKVAPDASLAEGLASLEAMRASIAAQPASAAFPESERRHALGAVDRSIQDVRTALGGGA